MHLLRIFTHHVLQHKQTVYLPERVSIKYRYSKLGFCAKKSVTECRITNVSYQSLSNCNFIKSYLSFLSPATHSVKMCDKINLKSQEGKPFERLPKNIVPSHYTLFLKPDLEKFFFEGSVLINIEVSLLLIFTKFFGSFEFYC